MKIEITDRPFDSVQDGDALRLRHNA